MFDKAERLTAEGARYGSQLVLFPEVFVGGYPHGSAFGLTIGSRSAKGKEDFRKYHASAIDVTEHTAVCPGGSFIISPSGAVLAAPTMIARPSSQLTWTLVKLFRQSLISTLWDTTHGLSLTVNTDLIHTVSFTSTDR